MWQDATELMKECQKQEAKAVLRGGYPSSVIVFNPINPLNARQKKRLCMEPLSIKYDLLQTY